MRDTEIIKPAKLGPRNPFLLSVRISIIKPSANKIILFSVASIIVLERIPQGPGTLSVSRAIWVSTSGLRRHHPVAGRILLRLRSFLLLRRSCRHLVRHRILVERKSSCGRGLPARKAWRRKIFDDLPPPPLRPWSYPPPPMTCQSRGNRSGPYLR